MSDANTEILGNGETGPAPKNSFLDGGMDPDFAAVWGEVFSDEDQEGAGEDAASAGSDAAGDAASAPAGEGAGTAGTDAAAQAGGTQPEAGAGTVQQPASNAQQSVAADAAAGQQSGTVAGGGSLDSLAVVAELGTVGESIESNLKTAFESQGWEEFRKTANPEYFEALEMHPYLLAGRKVPNPIQGQPDILLRDSSEARDWQEATKQLMEKEVDRFVQQRQRDVAPVMSVVQDSVMLFQNNPDLIPGGNQFDRELATRVMEIGQNYIYKVGDRVIGFHANMQPIINAVRADLAKSRAGANGGAARSDQQRQNAANQPRTESGQFTTDAGPQAGIQSKTGMVGDESDDYSVFLNAMGMPSNLIL